MVVASGWVQNANFPANQTNPNLNSAQGNEMTAKGILICRDNSHPFQERTLSLEQPVKIGRSVARARATPNNAIFDCKVLSRNHAVLWYSTGKFYLQDTRSSNGTFVNNQRLSASSLESAPKEVCSGDIVQFGVDVIENTRKVTHGCIVATLKLYLPDGKEAKASLSTSAAYPASTVSLEDLYKLNQVMEEAWRREKGLCAKLAYLKQLVENTRSATMTSWKALISEDRLLSWVDTVESQLVVYSKKYTEDKIRNELVALHEEKAQYQNAAKEALEKMLQEKLKVTRRVDQLQGRLNNRDVECMSLHNDVKFTQAELEEICRKYTQTHEQLQETTNKLMEAEQKVREIEQNSEQEKQELLNKLKDQAQIERDLRARIRECQLDSDNTHKQITALRNYMQTLQDMNTKVLASELIDTKPEENPIEVINTILNKLNSTKHAELNAEIDNIYFSKAEDNNTQDNDSNQLKGSNLPFVKDSRDDSLANEDTFAEYILPLSSRRTLVNGNGNGNGNVENSDMDSDTVSDATDDTCSIVSDDMNEKSIIENKKEDQLSELTEEKAVVSKMEVRFTCEESKEKLEVHSLVPESVVKEIGAGDVAEHLMDNTTVAPFVPSQSEEYKEEEMKHIKVTGGCEDEHLEGEYIKTLKPSKNDSSQSREANEREYVLQAFVGSLESLKGADDLESLRSVKKELEELKEWLIRESHDVIIEKLKLLYNRTKNDVQGRQEVNEELVILKEKYNAFVEEKAELSRKYTSLKAKCGDSLSATYTIPIYYVAPIAFMLLWMLLEKIF